MTLVYFTKHLGDRDGGRTRGTFTQSGTSYPDFVTLRDSTGVFADAAAFWATPQMTIGHLLLAAGMSVYMLIAIQYEERDLVGMYGRDY